MMGWDKDNIVDVMMGDDRGKQSRSGRHLIDNNNLNRS